MIDSEKNTKDENCQRSGCFKGLLVDNIKKINCFYFPKNTEHYKISSIGCTLSPFKNRVVITFYYSSINREFSFYNSDPSIRGLYDHVIWHYDNDHENEDHKRLGPLDEHSHFSCKISEAKTGKLDVFLQKTFMLSKLDINGDKKHCHQFIRGINYLLENEAEPGIVFQDGSSMQNEGSKNIYDKQAQDEQYIEGPYRMLKA